MTKRRNDLEKIKKKIYKGQLLLLFAIVILIFLIYGITNKPLISDLTIQEIDDKLVVSFKNNSSLEWSCNQSSSKNNLQSSNWQPAVANSCIFTIDEENSHYFLANSAGSIIEVGAIDNLSFITVIFSQKQLDLRIGEEQNYSFHTFAIGESYPLITYEYDEDAIELDPINKTVKGLKPGTYNLIIHYGQASDTLNINISNLLVSRDYSKRTSVADYDFSKEENDYLDSVLKTQINEVGYKTRAGVVEAARFLTLDFAFQVPYFFENGRIHNNVDGEGRYYHEGLYLNDDRFEDIAHSLYGPAVWGEKLYSKQTKTSSPNGLNCSGFVTWALVNGGYDPGDIGAQNVYGGWLCDLGAKLKPNKDNLDSIKVGDIVHSTEVGGHVGIIIGIDDENFYIAESLWYGPKCVTVTTLSYKEFINRFDMVILMDDFYQEDGKLSTYW